MFTGIIEETGQITKIQSLPSGKRFWIQASEKISNAGPGDSIAVNGVCLTVESNENNYFTFFTLPETLSITNIGNAQEGDRVNLERAATASTFLGGHIVQGHVEQMALVSSIVQSETDWKIYIDYDSPFSIHKGSLAVNGISLTIHEILPGRIRLDIIPETILKTNIGDWKKGTLLNIENDYVVKIIDSMVARRLRQGISLTATGRE